MPCITFHGLDFDTQAGVLRPAARSEASEVQMQVELTDLIDALPGLNWTALPDGQAEFLNRRWLEYTGMTAERASGRGWVEAIHPHDRRRLVEEWQSCVSSGRGIEAEGRMRRFDGAYRWFLFRANPLRDDTGRVWR